MVIKEEKKKMKRKKKEEEKGAIWSGVRCYEVMISKISFR